MIATHTIRILFACIALLMPLCGQEIPKHLADVRQLQQNTLPQNTSYRHRDRIVLWAGLNGASVFECHTDCSGLINALLEHSYNISKEQLHMWIGGKRRPRAKNYFDTFVEQKGFNRIQQINDLMPGDFIAMKYLPGSGDKGHDTGHILVVNSMPTEVTLHPETNPLMRRWTIEVIDCTRGHGRTDSRFWDGKYHPGIGKGNFSLFTDQQGNLVGYAWSTAQDSKFQGSNTRPLAAGRLRPL